MKVVKVALLWEDSFDYIDQWLNSKLPMLSSIVGAVPQTEQKLSANGTKEVIIQS